VTSRFLTADGPPDIATITGPAARYHYQFHGFGPVTVKERGSHSPAIDDADV
jgi:hypothetical protein